MQITAKWKNLINSPDLASVVGYLTGDGHLQIQKWRYLISFYSKNLDTIKMIENKFKKLFNIGGYIYIDLRGNSRYKIFFISKPLAVYLASIGVHIGSKTNNPHFVPSWIYHGPKEIKAAYLRAFYDCEGCIYVTKDGSNQVRWRINLEQWKQLSIKNEGKQFMEQIKSMLSEFGINSSPPRFGKKNQRKDGTQSIAIIIDIEYRNFSKFYKCIGFNDKIKSSKLKAALGVT